MTIMSGTTGGDNVTVSADQTVYYGLAGNDTISIQASDSVHITVFGGEGDDTITTTFLTFEVNGVFANGNQGNDSLHGEDGGDTLFGGQGADTVQGWEGNDLVNGNLGVDVIEGNEGNDTVHGGRGSDNVDGEEGDDVVYGDFGQDYLRGGTGADIFVMSGAAQIDSSVTSELDEIMDFSRAEGDKIGLAAGLMFDDLTITNNGEARIDYDAGGAHHTVMLMGVNINLVEGDFVTV